MNRKFRWSKSLKTSPDHGSIGHKIQKYCRGYEENYTNRKSTSPDHIINGDKRWVILGKRILWAINYGLFMIKIKIPTRLRRLVFPFS